MSNDLVFLQALQAKTPAFLARYKNLLLLAASSAGYLKTVTYLVSEHQANVNARQKEELAALGNTEESHFITSYIHQSLKPDYKAPDTLTASPLYAALTAEHYDLAHYLVAQGANIEAKYKQPPRDEELPLLYIFCDKKRSIGAVKFLILHRAKTQVTDEYGNTPLHRACFFEERAIIEMLIDADADLYAQAQGNWNKRPLDCMQNPTTHNKSFIQAVQDYFELHQQKRQVSRDILASRLSSSSSSITPPSSESGSSLQVSVRAGSPFWCAYTSYGGPAKRRTFTIDLDQASIGL